MNVLTILERSYTFEAPASIVEVIEDTSPAHTPVAFGCYAGHCAACMVTVSEGHAHLSEVTPFERYTLSERELAEHVRLACQLTIVSAGQITMRPTYS